MAVPNRPCFWKCRRGSCQPDCRHRRPVPCPRCSWPPRVMCGFRADPRPPPGPCRPPGWQQPPPLHPRLRLRLSLWGFPPRTLFPPCSLPAAPGPLAGQRKWRPARGPGSATVCKGAALGRPKPQAFIERQLDACMLRVRGPGANGGLGLRASEDLWFQNPPPPPPNIHSQPTAPGRSSSIPSPSHLTPAVWCPCRLPG